MYSRDSVMCCLLRCRCDNYYLEGSGVLFRLLDITVYLLNWAFALWTLLWVFQLTLSSMLELMVYKFQRKMETQNSVNCSRGVVISKNPTTQSKSQSPSESMTQVSAKTTHHSARQVTTANDLADQDSLGTETPYRQESSDECSDVDSSCTSVESFLRETGYSSTRGTDRSKSVCSSKTTKSSARCPVCPSSSSDSCVQKDDIHSDSSEDHSKILSSTACPQQADEEVEDEEKQCCVWSLDKKSTKQFCATRRTNMIFSSDHGQAFYSQSAASCRPMIQRVYSKQNGQNDPINFNKRNKQQICLMQSDVCRKRKYN